MTRPVGVDDGAETTADAPGFHIDIDAAIILGASANAMPPMSKKARFATVDPSFGSSGNPRVTFDGESVMSTKTYPFINNRPPAGSRVVMEPVGSGWLITGAFGGAGGLTKAFHLFTAGAIAYVGSTTAANKEICRLTIPDPGWPYYLAVMGQAYIITTGAEYDIQCPIDSVTGLSYSRQALGPTTGGKQVFAWPAYGGPITGSHDVLMVAYRISAGTGTLDQIAGPNTGGLTAWIFPA